jgi:threonine/homoserine efflux transporter RhtA
MTLARSYFARPLALVPLAFSLSGCAVIGDIFKAGVWVGVLAVVIVIALLAWAINAFAR